MERHAGPDSYDGIPYGELPIDGVDWEHRADYIRQRSHRKRQSSEFDVEPEWATEAALLDPGRLVRDSGSKTGESIEVVGYSVSADRILTVLLVPRDHPPTGEWWGASAWAASDADDRDYRKRSREIQSEREREHP